MRILMLGWELPPHNSGGLGVACYQLCKSLAQRNVDIEFVLPYTARHDAEFMKITAAHPQDVQAVLRAGIAYDSAQYIFSTGGSKTLDIYGQQAMFEHSIDHVIQDKTYDIIHAHDWLTFRAALKAKQVLGCPLVVHLHSVESDRAGGINKGNPLVKEIEGTALLLADKIIAVSMHTKRAIHRDYGIPLEDIEVVHNSIDKSMLEPLGDDNDYIYLNKLKEHGYKVVVSIGRLTLQKGLPNLLRAAQLVIKKNPKTMFLIVGDGEQYRELLELAGELDIAGNVIFTGFQRGKRWRDAFAVGDLFVMPSVSEPFGLTPLEAIHYGTPSLISRQSGVAEVLRNCLKVDFWDIQEMADKIVSTLSYDALRSELTANLTAEYDKLSWDKSIDKLMGVYQDQAQTQVAEVAA